MNTTIADIARIAGVAKSTVSRYLNGGSVSAKTKKKIERVILETGYIPNSFAQSLKAKRTSMIGTIVPRLDSYATSRTLMGIDEGLREMNYQMLIANTNLNLEREIESIYDFSRRKVAGIMLLATQITPQHLKAFQEVELPLLLIGQHYEGIHSLVHNDYEAGMKVGQHIAEMGHRKIAFLGVSEKDIAVGQVRKAGFQQAFLDLENTDIHFFETGFSMESAFELTSRIIEEFSPTIIVGATDNIALGALKAANARGLRVPDELSITGFGGYEVTSIMHPALTTMKYFYKDAGKEAAMHMIRLVNGEEVPLLTYSHYQLLERDSVLNMTVK